MDEQFFAVLAVIIAAIFLGLGVLVTHYNAYVLSEYDWKCSNWEIVNDKPHCTTYALKELNKKK
jgi:hypothetical protein